MDLLERIDEITANSVTPEEFKETWGYTVDEHVADMMGRIHQLEGRKYTPKVVKMARLGRIAAKPAAILVEPANRNEGKTIRLKRNVACRKSAMKGLSGPKGGSKGGPK